MNTQNNLSNLHTNYALVYSPLSGFTYEKYFRSEHIFKLDSYGQNINDELIISELAKEILKAASAIEGLVIDFHSKIGNLGNDLGFQLAFFLRLKNFSKPIFITGWNALADTSRLKISSENYKLIELNAVKYFTYDQLFGLNKDGDKIKLTGLKVRDFNLSNLLENHSPKVINDRHQISNEWGALRLAENCGYNSNELSYKLPDTLYFNFLKIKYQSYSIDNDGRRSLIEEAFPQNELSTKLLNDSETKINLNGLLNKKRILLIDDNADKGWKSVLEKIFDVQVDGLSFGMGILDKEIGDAKINRNIAENIEKYDIIFLDLYLPWNQSKPPNKNLGLKILKLIKYNFPNIPVIVFTASNKSWTLDEVLELGADGMYVKESPELAYDKQYSEENFRSFVKIVVSTLEKYKVLRPYWNSIQKILKSNVFQNLPEKTQGRQTTKFKERIEERLMMFFGLLKGGFEQRSYNQNKFFFSDYELAFMTLWSVLNEISEANYRKTQPITSVIGSDGNPLTEHPNGNQITYFKTPNSINHYKWEIKGQSDVYVEYNYSLKIDEVTREAITNLSGSYYRFNYEQKSAFIFENNSFSFATTRTTKINYENTLYLQIAFLIEKRTDLAVCPNKREFQQSLVRLNDIRNHLYLTHGSDINSGFYYKIEEENRNSHNINPNGDIKDLFELISFLLTGKEIKVDFI